MYTLALEALACSFTTRTLRLQKVRLYRNQCPVFNSVKSHVDYDTLPASEE